MTNPPLYLTGPSRVKIASLDVCLDEALYNGTIQLSATPPELLHLFEEFETLVEGQVFNVADEVEEKIAAYSLKAVFADGKEALVEDLQVFPSTKQVSFRVRNLSPTAP